MPFTVTMPKLSPTMEEGHIAKWHKKEGDRVEAGELLLEVATDKATIEHNALDGGYLRKILVPTGGRALVNQPIAIFTEKANENIDGYTPEKVVSSMETKPSFSLHQQTSFTPKPPLAKQTFELPKKEPFQRIVASPLAKKLAKEKGIDLSTVQGSGPRGRVVSRDLDSVPLNQTASLSQRDILSPFSGPYEEIPLSPMRRVIAQRLQEAKSFIPHIYVRQEVDAEPLCDAKEKLKQKGLKITFNDFCIRACSLALKEHPGMNSGFNLANQSLVLFKRIDISVAVMVDGGLITPIVRGADEKNLEKISQEVKELALRAKSGKLQPQEYQGGSFTISNMGMYGVTDFCAIINPPQSSILAIGAIEECVWVKNGVISSGKKMALTLSADHRVVDGAAAAQFIKTVQRFLENPELLMS